MLLELSVTDLGVIERLDLVLEPGMTAVTGETGAGKTLVVTAIELLVGGRADATMVRAGCSEAVVEGRFLRRVEGGEEEVVVRRVVPDHGRSRAYVDGSLATVGALADLGAELVDLHGQHSHQSLLSTAAQRSALDRYGGVDLAPLRSARGRLGEIDERLGALGGDDRTRAREIDLLRYQVEELDTAGLRSGEQEELEAEEELLADAVGHREAAARARSLLTEEHGAGDALGAAIAEMAGRAPFEELERRLRAVAAELGEAAHDLRGIEDGIADDPERLEAVRARLDLIHQLQRKYGATVDEVLSYAGEARDRLGELESHDERAAALEAERGEVREHIAALESEVGAARRRAAPDLAAAATARLEDLALGGARIEVAVPGDDPGDQVELRFSADDSGPTRPLAKVASGGELARLMLALRLILTAGPETLVFDEVDAGIGGSAALAVGRSLAALAPVHQVLVVTHLPQVAAYADHQVAVVKGSDGGGVSTAVHRLGVEERVAELSRMLSGSPDSSRARDHASELLEAAASDRGR